MIDSTFFASFGEGCVRVLTVSTQEIDGVLLPTFSTNFGCCVSMPMRSGMIDGSSPLNSGEGAEFQHAGNTQ